MADGINKQQAAETATLFGIQCLHELRGTDPDWVGGGERFTISSAAISLMKQECEALLTRLNESAEDLCFFESIRGLEERYTELVCCGRTVAMQLLDPFNVHRRRTKIKNVNGVIVKVEVDL
jgi:hypothetical protein